MQAEIRNEEQARHLTIHGSNQNEDGTYSWKFDNYVRAFPPIGIPIDDTRKMYGNIKCPTPLVRRILGRSGSRWAHQNQLPAGSRSLCRCGHWFYDQPEGFVGRVAV